MIRSIFPFFPKANGSREGRWGTPCSQPACPRCPGWWPGETDNLHPFWWGPLCCHTFQQVSSHLGSAALRTSQGPVLPDTCAYLVSVKSSFQHWLRLGLWGENVESLKFSIRIVLCSWYVRKLSLGTAANSKHRAWCFSPSSSEGVFQMFLSYPRIDSLGILSVFWDQNRASLTITLTSGVTVCLWW